MHLKGLGKVEQSTQWWTGDWWAFGEHKYGDRKKLVESEDWTGPAYETCRGAAVVCNSFESFRRRNNLSFEHHKTVVSIKDLTVADALLDWCEAPLKRGAKKVKSVRELQEEIVSRHNDAKGVRYPSIRNLRAGRVAWPSCRICGAEEDNDRDKCLKIGTSEEPPLISEAVSAEKLGVPNADSLNVFTRGGRKLTVGRDRSLRSVRQNGTHRSLWDLGEPRPILDERFSHRNCLLEQ